MFDPKTILIPVEIDIDDFNWLPTAFQFSRRLAASVHILFVNDAQAGYRHPTLEADDLEARIREHVDAKELEGLSIQFATSKGDVSTRVKEFCDEHQVDMLITGHKHHSSLYGLLFDTKDEGIIDAVELPVLVIPK